MVIGMGFSSFQCDNKRIFIIIGACMAPNMFVQKTQNCQYLKVETIENVQYLRILRLWEALVLVLKSGKRPKISPCSLQNAVLLLPKSFGHQ